jgi:hypothetical protein
LERDARKQLLPLVAGASSLRGDFFRSVAFRYFHPDDAISGEGTWRNGGRFVPIGVKAVYASLEEETAQREVTARKGALGGDASKSRSCGDAPTGTGEGRSALSSPTGYSASQELAAIWIADGIDVSSFRL